MSSGEASLDLRHYVRDIPDFPKPGILFRDLTPLMGDGPAFAETVRRLAVQVGSHRPQAVAAIESRGFIFGAAVAARLGLGFVPLRKPGKLPYRTRKSAYDLEYGSDGIEIHEDALLPGTRTVIVDDLLATGGTAAAALRLSRDLGAEVLAAVFVVELAALAGRTRLGGIETHALLAY
jgi:adenine phosphoribosyltransferase